LRRGRAPAHRRAADRYRGRRTGGPRSGRRGGPGEPGRGAGHRERRADSGGVHCGPGRQRGGAQRQRGHRGGRAGGDAAGGEAGRADRRRGSLFRLAGPFLAAADDPGQRPREAPARPGHRDDPEDGGLPGRGPGRCAEGARDRRPAGPLRAARGVHQPRNRNHGATRPGGRMITSNVDGQARWRSALMNNYGTPALTLVRGEGAYVWDADGNRYLDLVGGIAVNALGHAHPAVVEAVTAQIETLGHTSNLYINPLTVELAEALLDVAGLAGQGKVLFCNSGAEAVEAALKLTRLTGRTKLVACTGAFHGRTMGALTLTGQAPKRTQFHPL